jgi:hypothetical protein
MVCGSMDALDSVLAFKLNFLHIFWPILIERLRVGFVFV